MLKKVLTFYIREVCDGVPVLDVFKDAADEPHRAFWRGVHGDEPENLVQHRI